METTATTLGYFLLVGFAVGLAAGWWAATQRKDNNDDVINELRDEVEAAKAAHRSYEQSVTSHFANTAQLLHRMQDDWYGHFGEEEKVSIRIFFEYGISRNFIQHIRWRCDYYN